MLVFVFFGCIALSTAAVYLDNVDCGPYIDYIPTDPSQYGVHPMYVNLHRCHGKNYAIYANNRRCVPTASGIQSLNITVVPSNGGAQKTLTVHNHTSCEQVCVLTKDNCTRFQTLQKETCGCTCNHKDGAGLCQAPFVWDKYHCDCKCREKAQCRQRQEFSEEECGCTCKAEYIIRCAKRKLSINKDSCYCEAPVVVGKQQSGCNGGVNGTMLAVIIVVEFFFIVFCYYFFYVYCYKHNYLAGKTDKQNSGYYQNGDIPNERNSGTYHVPQYDDDYYTVPDKERIYREESNHPEEERERKTPPYSYPDEEKSPLTKQQSDDEYYMYGDIMQVDGPASSSEGHQDLNVPPAYSDCHSERSEEGYASVTQV